MVYWLIQAVSVGLLAAMAYFSFREWKAIGAVAKQTWKEAIRKKALWLVLFFALLIIGATIFIRAAGSEVAREERRLRIMVEVSFRAMSFLTVLTAIFLTSLSLPSDIADRQIFTILSKPISRWGLIFGKIVGFSMISFAMLGIMALVMLVFLRRSASSVPPEARDKLLGAREIIRPAEMTLLAWRQAMVKDNQVLLPMRPHIPSGSMFRFENPELQRLAASRQVMVRFKFAHFWEAEKKPVYSNEELRDCSMEFDLLEPISRKSERKQVLIDPQSELSEPFPVGGDYLVSGSLGIRVVKLSPPTRREGKISFLRPAETGRWVFRGLDRSALEVAPRTPALSPGGQSDAEASTPGGPTTKQIAVQVRLRNISRDGFYTGSRPVELRFGYRWESDTNYRGTAVVKIQDARVVIFYLPSDAVSDQGEVVIDLETPLGTSFYPGYDHENYGLFLLSAPRSFEFNIFKAVIMVSFQVILLVVIAAAASTFLSWPVTALMALFVYGCGNFVGFFGDLVEAIEKTGLKGMGEHLHESNGEHKITWLDHLVKFVLEALRLILPDLDRFSPLSLIGEGYSVGLGELASAFYYMSTFATLALATGWIIFRKRSVD